MKPKFDINDILPSTEAVMTEETVTKQLVERFAQRRKELKLSQAELSKRSGVAYASVRRFEESGAISLTSLMLLAKTMGYLEDFDELFKTSRKIDLKEIKKLRVGK